MPSGASAQDTLKPVNQSELIPDTIPQVVHDSLTELTLSPQEIKQGADTILNKLTDKKPDVYLDTKVERSATDSIIQDLKNQKVYLYGTAVVTYGEIKMEADYIEIDFNTNEVFAKGVPDSTGKLMGNPVFTENGQKFEAKEMRYNFDTKKGLISKVVTEDGQGFLHGVKVKKMPDNTINIGSGSYTTCNDKEHPHFEFRFKKSKVIPDNKIVTGPAYMTIENVPTPLAIPFGMFPNKTGQRSGILIPTYGEMNNMGFYLQGGGYYFGISKYMDLEIRGDIYTRGSWALKPTLRYSKRYKYNGYFNTSYAINIIGNQGSADYVKSKDFLIRWTHNQDAKARPNGRFTANVNIKSSNQSKYNPTSSEDYLSNTFNSSISYQTNFNNKLFLNLNATHSQNTKTKMVSIELPRISLASASMTPLKKKDATGKPKWYEALNMRFSTNATNKINLPDSMLFKPGALKKLQNNIDHSIPIILPIKVLKYFTLSNSININDRMYFSTRKKSWINDTLFDGNDTIVGYVKTDTIQGFKNEIDFGMSTSLSTKVYGMVNFKRGPIRAIRHVITPSVGFSYTPEFGDPKWGYYDSYIDGEGEEIFYSKFEDNTPAKNKSGSINFSLSNNLEIKVPSKKDTVTGMKKVVLIKDLSISGNYNLAGDSLNLSYITVKGNTLLFQKLNVTYGSTWDPYIVDSTGKRRNQFEWDVNKRLLRMTRNSLNFGFSWNLNQKELNKNKESSLKKDKERTSTMGTEDELAEINKNPEDYVDWSVPWSLNLNYTFSYQNQISYVKAVEKKTAKVVQSLGFSGEVNVSPKWKIGFASNWDFKTNSLTYTSLNIYRDLHCWEMRFNWIPTGQRQSWNFSINVKASVLQDLKLNKKKDFRDL
ncbi:MAG: LPS-assembly protein LptD [Bacteroidales bacterium]|nr:LPS-assembly protein LptD [Bacteroidales bacterium]